MKRTLYALVPWMVLATTVYGQVRSADVAYAHSNAIPTRGFRLGDEAFVPIDGAAMWGWITDVKGDQAVVRAEGKTLNVALRSIAGRPSLPVRRIVSLLGGHSDWIPGMETLEVWSDLSHLTFKDGHLRVTSPLAVRGVLASFPGPGKVAFDLVGSRLSDRTQLNLDPGAKVVQYRPNVVRIIVDSEDSKPQPEFTEGPTRDFQASFDPSKKIVLDDETVRRAVTPEPVVQITPMNDNPPTAPVETGPLPLFVDTEGPSSVLLSVRTPNVKGLSFTKPSPSSLEVRLPGVFRSLPPEFKLKTDAVLSASTRVDSSGTVLSLTLARPMGAEVWSDAAGAQIQLLKPDVGNGKLAGKIVVVDPGHGGTDTGARAGGVNEKDLNLSISKLLSAELAKFGATVIMTRKTDVAVSLGARAEMANRNNADLFISVHINSTAKPNGTSGTITFHHKGRAVGKLLAECIQREIAKVNELPNLGVWSDGRIYNSGFAVLRGTKMPGVLLELGFINHAKDRARMITDDFQTSVAKAVVKGLKVYLGDE